MVFSFLELASSIIDVVQFPAVFVVRTSLRMMKTLPVVVAKVFTLGLNQNINNHITFYRQIQNLKIQDLRSLTLYSLIQIWTFTVIAFQFLKDIFFGYLYGNRQWNYQSFTSSKYQTKNFPKAVKYLRPSQLFSLPKLAQLLQRFSRLVFHRQLFKNGGPINPNWADFEPERIINAAPGAGHAVLPLRLANLFGNRSGGVNETLNITRHLVENYTNDEEFAQQFLQGVNPLHIKVLQADDAANLPSELKELSPNNLKFEDLLRDKRLYILDYQILQGLEQPVKTRFFLAPTLVLYKELPLGQRSRLNVWGITLNDGTNVVYHPGMAHQNKYLLAKIYLNCADSQIHEFQYHLGFAHLTIEPFAIATHNCFERNHPIRLLLQPHFDETIFINYLARHDIEFTDIMAIGTKQGIDYLCNKFFEEWDFFEYAFDRQLYNRGFGPDQYDGVDNYYYRDDGFLLWNALGEYARTLIMTHYYTEQEFQEDVSVELWARQINSRNLGNVRSFPNQISSRKELIKVCQIIMWNGSGLHSALNYPQFSYNGFVPNRPNAVYTKMRLQSDRDMTPEELEKAFATGLDLDSQIATYWILSTPSLNHFMNINAFEGTKYQNVSDNFRQRMIEITNSINLRNDGLVREGKTPYYYLLPRNVACSVNI